MDRLQSLHATGEIADFETRTWPETVVRSGHTDHPHVVEAFETFEAWADDRGVSITPPFERRTVTSQVGRTCEALTLPVACLAVYDGGDLCGVFPCRRDGRSCTVADFLDTCEADRAGPAAVAATLLESGS